MSAAAPFTVDRVVAAYERGAVALAAAYEGLDPAAVHAPFLDLMPPSGARVLDVGAGSGRDASWFADTLGYRVTAVEPCAALRAEAMRRHPSASIEWSGERLPSLSRLRREQREFDLIWVNGVWMHLPPAERALAFAALAGLMAPNGGIAISTRSGPAPVGRPAADASARSLSELGSQHGLVAVRCINDADARGCHAVRWLRLWFGADGPAPYFAPSP